MERSDTFFFQPPNSLVSCMLLRNIPVMDCRDWIGLKLIGVIIIRWSHSPSARSGALHLYDHVGQRHKIFPLTSALGGLVMRFPPTGGFSRGQGAGGQRWGAARFEMVLQQATRWSPLVTTTCVFESPRINYPAELQRWEKQEAEFGNCQ